jgi:DNA-binding transcriptional LysR family regulator
MRLFLKVAESGSFAAASDLAGVTIPTVSRSIAELEDHLRTRLLHRTTRRMTLTSAGQRYAERCMHLLSMVEEAEGEARQSSEKPFGLLRLNAFAGIGHHYVIPTIASFRELAPEVSVELTLSQRLPDLLQGFDSAIVLAERLPDSELIAQELGTSKSILCASPSFLKRIGKIRTPSDLERVPCVEMTNPLFEPGKWSLIDENTNQEHEVRISGSFRANGTESVAKSVECGLGIGALPIYTAIQRLRSGSLVRVLPEYILQPMGIFVLYSSSLYLDAKIRTWIEHVKVAIPKQLAEEQPVLRCLHP